MAANTTRAGFVTMQVNGDILDVVGNVTYNMGENKNEKLVGANGVHGTKSMPQVPFLECEVRTSSEFSRQSFARTKDATVVLVHADGTSLMYQKADYCANGDGGTEEGIFQCRFEAQSAEEILA